jgi:DNA (cytosine-5)-methyltransferase 1
LDFFSGSGLVGYALAPYFASAWANDISPKKAAVHLANHPDTPLHLGSITEVSGSRLPDATLSWASFPCQDLSLAGKMEGLRSRRSGLVWEWLRVIDEMPRKPPILVAENVLGLISTHGGQNYRELHDALLSRGYFIGAMVLDAAFFLPQSRQRVFVVAIKKELRFPPHLMDDGPNYLHPQALITATKGLSGWIWWRLPKPQPSPVSLYDLLEKDVEFDDDKKSKYNIRLIPEHHWRFFINNNIPVAPGYKRIRDGKQVLELRFDGLAGCLRTPAGGSSRQYLVIKTPGGVRTRLFTVRETARLMGAPDDYIISGTYNDGYRAMGDAVAVPVVRYLAKHLLSRLARRHE